MKHALGSYENGNLELLSSNGSVFVFDSARVAKSTLNALNRMTQNQFEKFAPIPLSQLEIRLKLK